MKKTISFILVLIFALSLAFTVSAEEKYTVVKGDSLWKISVRYEVGLSEIIEANPQIKIPDLIYPGDVVTIPDKDYAVLNYEHEVVRLTNIERTKRGLPALTENWELSRCSRYKSQDMKDMHYFAHQSPTYGSPFDMMRAFGISFRAAGENIAYGYRTPADVVAGWMNSEGHRANILNASFKEIGVGYVASGNYWTQQFIG